MLSVSWHWCWASSVTVCVCISLHSEIIPQPKFKIMKYELMFFFLSKWAWDLPRNNITFYSICCHGLRFDRRNFSWLRLVRCCLFLSWFLVLLFFYSFDVESNIITRENCRLRKNQRWLILIFPLCTFHKFKFTTIPKITFCSDVLFSFFSMLYMENGKAEEERHQEIGFFKVSTVFTHLISSQCYISFLCMPLLWLWWMLAGWWLTTLAEEWENKTRGKVLQFKHNLNNGIQWTVNVCNRECFRFQVSPQRYRCNSYFFFHLIS